MNFIMDSVFTICILFLQLVLVIVFKFCSHLIQFIVHCTTLIFRMLAIAVAAHLHGPIPFYLNLSFHRPFAYHDRP
jgi:hypothetical protein